MNIYKRYHLLKSFLKAVLVGAVLICVLCYQVGWHNGYSRCQQNTIFQNI